MKRYFTPNAELFKVIPKEDILQSSLEFNEEGVAPDVSYGDGSKWETID